eukprot:1693975-Heterocapsa_arctica.AAC.1
MVLARMPGFKQMRREEDRAGDSSQSDHFFNVCNTTGRWRSWSQSMRAQREPGQTGDAEVSGPSSACPRYTEHPA